MDAAVQLADALLRQVRVTGHGGLAIEAERALRAAMARDPEHYGVCRMLAAVQASLHRFVEARTLAERCRSRHPRDAFLLGVIADANIELGDDAAAWDAIDTMMALRPDAAAYARASYARERQGDPTGALELMRMARDATPPSDAESVAWHHVQIGHLLLASGRTDDAARAFAHARHVFPDYPAATEGHARVLIAAGDRNAAVRILTPHVSAVPTPDGLALLGDLHQSLGDHEAAERAYQLAEAAWMADAPDPRARAVSRGAAAMSVRGWPTAAPALSALLVLALTAAPAAHPGAASDLIVEIARPGTVDVLLTTDPEALLLKLGALAPSDAGSAFVPPGVDRPLAQRIAAFQRVLVDHVSVTADDQPLALAWIALEDPEHPADRRAGKIVVRLRAAVPPGVTALRVRTGLIFGTYALIVRGERGPETIAWLHGAEESAPIDFDDTRREPLTPIVLNGLRLGFTHIVPSGLDHVLFVLGLFLLTPRLRALVAQVSVFTLAHSATLAAMALGMISPPGAIVEPLIALSIVLIAFENIIRSTVSRWRLWLIFCFGLLHGMGFAGALTALDLTRSHLLTTIVTFNVGVELAQIAVLAAAAAVVRASAIAPDPYRRFVVRPASLAIAAMGVIWLLERVT